MSLTRVPRRMLDVDIADQQYVQQQIAALTTDTIAEGLSHQYFTNTRARTAISVSGGLLTYDSGTGVVGLQSTPFTAIARAALSVTGDLYYDSSTGLLSYTGLTTENMQDAVATMFTTGVNSGITAVYDDSANRINLTVSYPTTDGIVEGTSNLYFTQDRARASLQAGDGVYYDAISGAFSVNPFFANIVVPGKSSIRANVANDTFTLTAGSGMAINTIPAQNTIVISYTGAGGGTTDPLYQLSMAMVYGG